MKKFTPVLVLLGILFIVLMLLGNKMFYTLEPGERGVIFRPFGFADEKLDKENIHPPGFLMIAPWNTLYVYDVKEQQREETMDVLDKNGLSVNVDISVRFNPKYDRIGNLHEIFGQEYVTRLVVPEVRSSVRKVMGRYTAEEIYSTQRKTVEDEITFETKEILDNNHIIMQALLIRSINLPLEIKQAIENKLKQEQESLAYEFKLSKEKQEAERKKIEAQAIAIANDIVNSSLTDKLLKMKGIDATMKLSESPNAKVVVIGGGKDGLPLILGNN